MSAGRGQKKQKGSGCSGLTEVEVETQQMEEQQEGDEAQDECDKG